MRQAIIDFFKAIYGIFITDAKHRYENNEQEKAE